MATLGSSGLPVSTTAGSLPLVGNVTYDALSRPVRTELGALGRKVYDTRVIDEHTGSLVRRTLDGDQALRIEDTRYSYDAAGNTLRISSTSGQDSAATTDTQCFALDALRRMTEAWTTKAASDDCASGPSATTVGGPYSYWHSYTYDVAGNRAKEVRHTTASGVSDITRTYIPGKAGEAPLRPLTFEEPLKGKEMNQANRKTIVMRRKSFSALSWAILAAMAFFATLAAEDVSSGAARGPLTGIAACLGTIVLVRRIMASRIELGESELKVVNPVFTYRIPYRMVTEVDTSQDGTLTIHTSEGGEIYSVAFGGSLLDHFIGTSDRAVARIKETVRQRRSPRTEGPPRRIVTVSWIADFCLLGTIGVAVAALLAPG